MSTQVQYRRGTNAQNAAFTGALAEITVDTTNGTLRVHDGINAGGSNIATVAYVTAQIGALSANSISSGTSNVRVVSSGGNVTTSVGGTANVLVITSTGANVAGYVTATGNITGGNFIGTLNGSGANVTSISATNISSGTLAQARLANASVTLGSTALTLGATVTTVAGLSSVTSTTFVGSLTGAATTAGTVTTAAQPNITSVGTLTSVTSSGNIQGANVIATADIFTPEIVKTGSNAVGNIGQANNYFNRVFAQATSALYADLAEMYVSDAD
jgi:hypothetical protein